MSDTTYGLLAVTGAIISFGCYGIPVKTKAVQDANVSPMIFQVYAAVAVSLSSLLVLTYNDFIWSWWGTLGAGLWMSSQPFAFFAINHLGVALGPAIWAGTTIAVSFIWGTALFEEPVKDLGLCILAIVILVLGIGGVTASGTELPRRLMGRCKKDSGHEEYNGREVPHPTETDPMIVNNAADQKKKPTSKLIGLSSALIMGVMNGSLMVPFTLFVRDQEGAPEGTVVELGYLVSFSIGIVIVTPVVFAVFFLASRERPVFHFRVATLPGLTTGILWSFGNFCSLYATLYLGSTVGYPLTQACIVISALWGVFYFKEIRGPAILVLALSTAVVLGGAAMLTYYGDG